MEISTRYFSLVVTPFIIVKQHLICHFKVYNYLCVYSFFIKNIKGTLTVCTIIFIPHILCQQYIKERIQF